jgi:glycerophosphoryl diester phosphodiesterase
LILLATNTRGCYDCFMRMLLLLPLVIACSADWPATSLPVEIIGHRGASYDAPENTLAAFRLGYQQGADAVELDMHLSDDGEIVVIHDDHTARVAGISNRVDQCSFADLRRLEVGQWGKWQGKGFSEKLPSLEAVLRLVPKNKRLFMEIKCGPEILPRLQETLRRASKQGRQTVLIGFDYETMRQAKATFPALEVCWLAQANKQKEYPPVGDLIEKAKAARLDGLDLHSGFPIDAAFVAKVHAAGLKLYTWTVDDPETARNEVAAGVDGITTNRPGWLRRQL